MEHEEMRERREERGKACDQEVEAVKISLD